MNYLDERAKTGTQQREETRGCRREQEYRGSLQLRARDRELGIRAKARCLAAGRGR